MRFVVGSAFRSSSETHVARWARQVAALRKELRQHYYGDLRAVAAEGDSTNDTRGMLVQYARELGIDLELVDASHGGPHFGSTEHPDRLKALSKVGNAILGSVRQTDDVLIYVESDLVWEPDQILGLVRHVAGVPAGDPPQTDVAAPLIFAGEHFYDIFVYRKDGERFGPFPPYHPGLAAYGLTDVDSAGSCLVMKAEVARQCRIRDNNVLIGFCADVRDKGFRISVDPSLRVVHP